MTKNVWGEREREREREMEGGGEEKKADCGKCSFVQLIIEKPNSPMIEVGLSGGGMCPANLISRGKPPQNMHTALHFHYIMYNHKHNASNLLPYASIDEIYTHDNSQIREQFGIK